MERAALMRLTGMIGLRLGVVALVSGGVGWTLLFLGVPLQIGASLITVAVLAVPPALVAFIAWLVRRPATALPRWLLWLGVVGTAVGLGWLLVDPGNRPGVIVFALGRVTKVVSASTGSLPAEP